METNPGASGSGEGPSSSSPAPAGAPDPSQLPPQPPPSAPQPPPSRYESQKRRDWNTFQQYLKNHKPPLSLSRCSGAHVIEFLKYLDQFGKTKVHNAGCSFFGHPNPPSPCACPLKQAWGSLDALIGRLRAAYEEDGGRPESNPFGARAVRIYLRDVRESQAKARGIPYEKKKRKRTTTASASSSSSAQAGEGGEGAGEGAGASTTATVTTTVAAASTGASVGDTGGSGASAVEGSGALRPPGGSSSAHS